MLTAIKTYAVLFRSLRLCSDIKPLAEHHETITDKLPPMMASVMTVDRCKRKSSNLRWRGSTVLTTRHSDSHWHINQHALNTLRGSRRRPCCHPRKISLPPHAKVSLPRFLSHWLDHYWRYYQLLAVGVNRHQ